MAGKKTARPRTSLQTASVRPRTAITAGGSGYGGGGGQHDEQAPAPLRLSQVAPGSYTHCIYSLIRDERYNDAAVILAAELVKHPARAGLSLLAFCYYSMQEWTQAASVYDELCRTYPSDEYRIYQANAIYKAGDATQAITILQSIKTPETQEMVRRVHAAIKYSADDYAGSQLLVDQCVQDDTDVIFNQACLLYKMGKYENALEKLTIVLKRTPNDVEVIYNIALCHYQTKKYADALRFTSQVVEIGIEEHPELNVGVRPDEILSVGNTPALYRSYLVETFNLKAAIEYALKNTLGAKEALTDMPPRLEEELDSVTLHNQAIVFDEDAMASYEKLIYILQQGVCPPETFSNLLMMYLGSEFYEAAADLLAENEAAARNIMSKYNYDYLRAVLMRSTSPEDSYKALEEIGVKLIEQMRKQGKRTQENDETRELLERYMPVMMAQAKIYWDKLEFEVVEKIFRKTIEHCSEHYAWKMNVAHVLFMQEKYKEAITFYEPIVKGYASLLEITPIVLANLCVSYIMLYQNVEAEELMRQIELEEAKTPGRHLCIVNLVIGTLYCSKGNYEFGISRVLSSMEPVETKLAEDTWYHVCRCLLALYEALAKQTVVIKDETIAAIIDLLDKVVANCNQESLTEQAILLRREYQNIF